MAKKQFYGIKFPITIKSEWNTALDLCESPDEKIVSDLMHLIFTPKGQKIRDPKFGTDLIQYIFNPNDDQTWGDVINSIRTSVKEHIPECNVNNIEVAMTEDGLGLYARIIYTISLNGADNTYQIITKL